MKRFFTLKLYVFAFFALLCRITALSQSCTGIPGTTCIAVTDQFATSSFGNPSGDFAYETPVAIGQPTGDYIIGGNTRGLKRITSYVLSIQNNIFSVGAQITTGLNRISTAATIQVLNASTNAVICQTDVTMQSNGCLSATFSGLAGVNVKIAFLFTKTGNGGTTFDNFGIDPAQTVLPVTFTGLQGMKTAKGTELTWKVGGEVNVARYDVERSTTGNGGFAKIGSIVATGSSRYTFTDATNFTGDVFYRIKNVDNDGRFKYSTMLQFRNSTSTIVFRVVPTLVTNKAVVQHPASAGTTFISLTSTAGRTVRTIRPAAGAVETSIDMTGLQPGLYLLKWSDGSGSVKTAKVIKQ